MPTNTSYSSVTVTTTATLIVPVNGNRKGLFLFNNSSQTVYIGPDSSVTTSNGMPVVASGNMFNSGLYEGWRGDIYGIVAATTADVRYWEWGQ